MLSPATHVAPIHCEALLLLLLLLNLLLRDLSWLLGHQESGIVAPGCPRLEAHFEGLGGCLADRLLGDGELGAIEDVNSSICLLPPALCEDLRRVIEGGCILLLNCGREWVILPQRHLIHN